MSFEKRWAAIAPRSFTADGGVSPANAGLVTLSSTIDYRVKQKVIILATGQLSLNLEVKQVNSDTTMFVGPVDQPITARQDLTGYTVANGAQIFANEQPRPPIPEKDYQRAMFEEDPVNAQRSFLVDDFGDSVGNEGNPLQVETDIQGVAIFTKPYDSVDADLTGSTVDIYMSYVGGYPPSSGLTPVGTLEETCTINYTDATKNNIKNLYRIPFI